MRRMYVEKSETRKVIEEISREQAKVNIFINIAIKPYTGKKYNPASTDVIVLG